MLSVEMKLFQGIFRRTSLAILLKFRATTRETNICGLRNWLISSTPIKSTLKSAKARLPVWDWTTDVGEKQVSGENGILLQFHYNFITISLQTYYKFHYKFDSLQALSAGNEFGSRWIAKLNSFSSTTNSNWFSLITSISSALVRIIRSAARRLASEWMRQKRH